MDETSPNTGNNAPETVAEETVETGAGRPEPAEKYKGFPGEKPGRNKYLLTGLAGFLGALLVCALVVGSFATGYAVGNNEPVLPRDRMSRDMGKTQSLEGPGGASGRLENRRERAGEIMEEFGAGVLPGKVVSVEAGMLVLETADGEQVVKITDSTVVRGGQDITAGDQVTVMLKEVEGSEPEAMIIRIAGNLNRTRNSL
ncbi:MAG: hypothetical protein JXA49_03865 [Actinobacteria bacterium]|nr:hypothetical protein [Actinomycetota bacterium]